MTWSWMDVVRRVHAWVSLPLALLILFFAVTGFIANHPRWFVGESSLCEVQDLRPLPETALAGPEALLAHCGSLVVGATRAEVVADDGTRAEVRVGGPGLAGARCLVDKAARSLELIPSHAIPTEAGTAKESLVAWVAARVAGEPTAPPQDAEEDAAAGTISFDTESAWGRNLVTIRPATRTYEVREHRLPWAKSLSDLHRGRHAGPGQSLLLDLAALALALTVLTGLALGLRSGARPWVLALVLTASCAAAVIYLVHR